MTVSAGDGLDGDDYRNGLKSNLATTEQPRISQLSIQKFGVRRDTSLSTPLVA